MIGVVVTGHGGVAAGLMANVKMLAGAEAEVKAVDFLPEMDVESFEAALTEAVDAYADCDSIIVLADVAGGTPYNRAAGLSMTRPKMRVISGANSAMVMDLCMRNITEDEAMDTDALVEEVMETGRGNIGKFVLEIPAETDDFGDDGI